VVLSSTPSANLSALSRNVMIAARVCLRSMPVMSHGGARLSWQEPRVFWHERRQLHRYTDRMIDISEE
jgi:hypothetical protein